MLKCTAILNDTKNDDDREIPLSSKAIEVIELLPRHITGFLILILGDSVTQAFSHVYKNAKIKICISMICATKPPTAFLNLGWRPWRLPPFLVTKTWICSSVILTLKAEDLAKKLG